VRNHTEVADCALHSQYSRKNKIKKKMQGYKSESSVLDELQNERSRVRSDSGRLFQTSGPQTVNARRPKSIHARWMMAEHKGHLWGSDKQKVTRSATYDGHRWAMTRCRNTAVLNWMRYFTG